MPHLLHGKDILMCVTRALMVYVNESGRSNDQETALVLYHCLG